MREYATRRPSSSTVQRLLHKYIICRRITEVTCTFYRLCECVHGAELHRTSPIKSDLVDPTGAIYPAGCDHSLPPTEKRFSWQGIPRKKTSKDDHRCNSLAAISPPCLTVLRPDPYPNQCGHSLHNTHKHLPAPSACLRRHLLPPATPPASYVICHRHHCVIFYRW